MYIKTSAAEYLVKVKLDSIDIKDNVSILCMWSLSDLRKRWSRGFWFYPEYP